MIEIKLPWPPSVNHYKRVGRTRTTKTGKKYQARVDTDETKTFYWCAWIRIQSLNPVYRKNLPLISTINMEVHLHPPDKRKRDIDNPIKVLLDSLVKGGLLLDDSQISRLLIERKDIIEDGKVIVRIQELT